MPLAPGFARAYFGRPSLPYRPMRWIKPNLRNSLHDLLGRDKPSSTGWVRHQGLEVVRKAMLQTLSGLAGCEVARMSMRLRYAADIEALWYLRSDLQGVLAPLRGTAAAQAEVERITHLFQGQLPTAPRPAHSHAPHP